MSAIADAGGPILTTPRLRLRQWREEDLAPFAALNADPQVMEFPDAYGPRPPWHDMQAEVHGPAVHDLEHTFRERWYGSSVLDVPSPLRQLYDRAYHMGAMTSRPLPDGSVFGTHIPNVLVPLASGVANLYRL
jgi:hypothetical protein